MSLVPHKITALAESDAQGTDGKNIVEAAVVSMYDTDGNAVILYDDENGTNGSTAKQTDSQGVVVVYVEQGEYDEEVNGNTRRRVLVGASRGGIASYQTVAEIQALRFESVGQRVECRDLWYAQFEQQPAVYTPNVGDITGATGLVWKLLITDEVNVKWLGAKGDGVTVDTQAFKDAVTLGSVYAPDGEYVIDDTIRLFVDPTLGIFSKGLRIRGSGILTTKFLSRVSGPLFILDSKDHVEGSYKASFGATLTDFTIDKDGTPTNSVGIQIVNAYQVNIERFYIRGMSIGIEGVNGEFIDDGYNMVNLRNGWIDSCANWGIYAVGQEGRNEASFLNMDHVFIQSCGVNDGGTNPPTSGGVAWKGQIMNMNQCAFANGVENVGLYIVGGGGLGKGVFLENTTFENTKGWAVLCTGVAGFTADQCQIYNNDTFQSENLVEFIGDSYAVKNVFWRNTNIRITAGNNPCTAFKFTGANVEYQSCKVDDTYWEAFDATGQVRFDGVKDKCTIVAEKQAAQSVFNSESAIIWDTVVSDVQGCLNVVNGRWTIPYQAIANFEGNITLENLDANSDVVISLYNVEADATLRTSTHQASGAASETFPFDFTSTVGTAGTTRSYEIRISQGSVGSKAIDITPAANNSYKVTLVK